MTSDTIRAVILYKWPIKELYGGVDVHVVNLVKNMQLITGLDTYVVSFGDRSQVLHEGKAKIVLIKRRYIYYILPILALIRLRSEIDRINPDIIHVQGTNISPYLIYALILAEKWRRRIITVHGMMAIEGDFDKGICSIIKRYLSSKTEIYALSSIHEIIVCSPAIKCLVNEITNSRVHIIPNGVNIETVEEISCRPNTVLKHPSILFVGRISKVKGLDLLLNAVPFILNSVPEAHVYVLGSGEQESECRDIIRKLHIEKNVDFLGQISGREKYDIYKSVDVCVVPSLFESFGIVLLESMACGKPLVASDVGGIPYLIDDGVEGLLFECGNFEDLAKKVILLLENKRLREKMGLRGRIKAKNFSWDKIAYETFKLYEKISLRKNSRDHRTMPVFSPSTD